MTKNKDNKSNDDVIICTDDAVVICPVADFLVEQEHNAIDCIRLPRREMPCDIRTDNTAAYRRRIVERFEKLLEICLVFRTRDVDAERFRLRSWDINDRVRPCNDHRSSMGLVA